MLKIRPGALIKLFLKDSLKLDFVGDVVDKTIDVIEDLVEGARDGWTEADDAALADGLADITRQLSAGFRGAIPALRAARRARARA